RARVRHRQSRLCSPSCRQGHRAAGVECPGRSRRSVMKRLYVQAGKRVLDIGIAASALVLLSPVTAFVALVVRWRIGRPVLFRQRRPGLHGRPFTILKFRTMRQVAAGSTISDSNRLGITGQVLRATSLDELPQLVNVLRGDMSLVGPRPLLMQYLDRYTP